MDVQTIGMIAGAFVAGTVVPYVIKKVMALRKKKPAQRRRRVIRVPRRVTRHVHQYFPENEE